LCFFIFQCSLDAVNANFDRISPSSSSGSGKRCTNNLADLSNLIAKTFDVVGCRF
jgi:hypothetical protein